MYIVEWQDKNDNRMSVSKQPRYNNYLITESEVVTGKSQTEALPYWPSDSEVNTARPRFEIFP